MPMSSNFVKQQLNVIVFYLHMLDITTFVMAMPLPYKAKMRGALLPCMLCPCKFYLVQVDTVLLGSKLLELCFGFAKCGFFF
jgi:hypothetical protein